MEDGDIIDDPMSAKDLLQETEERNFLHYNCSISFFLINTSYTLLPK